MYQTPNIPSSAFLAEIRSTFLVTYRDTILQNPKLPRCMALGLPSDKRTEYYGYWESPPVPERWERGSSIPREAGQIVTFSVVNLAFGKGIDFHEHDEQDLKLGDMQAWTRGLARRYSTLPERIFFQIAKASTNPKLLPSIPTAPDGAAIFATTANGSARFGVTGGNLLTGSGCANAQNVRNDFYRMVEQFRAFQDTKGEPLHDESMLDSFTIVYNSSNDWVFREAFQQGRTVGAIGSPNAAAPTNIILESGLSITLWPTQRLTDDDWMVFADKVEPRPVFEQIRMPLRSIESDRANSDRAREELVKSFLTDMRAGYGVALPYAAGMVNNP
jgi:hypothetical protein